MTIQIGDKIPAVLVKHLTDHGVQDINTKDIFAGKKIVMFGLPGAFTPTCSTKQLPSYIAHANDFKALDVELICLAVNDPYVMHTWLTVSNSRGITPLADGNGVFTKALDLEIDGSVYGLGTRTQRSALYIEDGVVKILNVEKPGEYCVSAATAMLEAVKNYLNPSEPVNG